MVVEGERELKLHSKCVTPLWYETGNSKIHHDSKQPSHKINFLQNCKRVYSTTALPRESFCTMQKKLTYYYYFRIVNVRAVQYERLPTVGKFAVDSTFSQTLTEKKTSAFSAAIMQRKNCNVNKLSPHFLHTL